jgi:3-methyladenine DNA glycosylase AlkD
MSSAQSLIAALVKIADPAAVEKVRRFFKGGDPATDVMGVSIGKVFPVAKRFVDMSLEDVEALLDDPRYEVRMAAVSIMDFKARRKNLSDNERQALFDLYLRRHDRINNWDLVDRAAPHVIGEFLVDKDRSILDQLARSDDPHQRRTAIVSTYAFIRRGETDDTFRVAAALAGDGDDYVQKAIASWVREAGKRNPNALVDFVERNGEKLPRSTITSASKLLSEDLKDRLCG